MIGGWSEESEYRPLAVPWCIVFVSITQEFLQTEIRQRGKGKAYYFQAGLCIDHWEHVRHSLMLSLSFTLRCFTDMRAKDSAQQWDWSQHDIKGESASQDFIFPWCTDSAQEALDKLLLIQHRIHVWLHDKRRVSDCAIKYMHAIMLKILHYHAMDNILFLPWKKKYPTLYFWLTNI